MKVATVFRFGLVTALLVAATGICLAVPNTFNKGDVVSAAQMNQNFADLDTRVSSPTRLATSDAGVTYSLGATKSCGATDPHTGKFDPAGGSGYVFAKAACETKCASKSAHMCTSEEAVRLAQMGQPMALGWMSTGSVATTPGPSAVVNDCYGYTTNVGQTAGPTVTQQFGAVWAGSFVSFSACDTSNTISCCD